MRELIPVVCIVQAQLAHIKNKEMDATSKNLKQAFLDPSVNLLFAKMKTEIKETKEKLERSQNELSAWKFTPDRYNYCIIMQISDN